MSETAPATDAAAFCADLVRSHDFPRYASTVFVPPAQRRSVLALYAFNVEIVRIPDQVSQPLPGEIRLQWWSDMLAGQGHGGVEGNPVAAELLRAIREHGLPIEPLTRLIEARQADLYNDPMPTLAALERYLDATHATLFALAGRILSPPSATIDHLAHHAGLAQGLMQVMVELPRHAARRQLYLPQEALERHGAAVEEVFAGKPLPSLRAALSELAREAQRHLETALAGLADLPREARAAFLPLALVRSDLNGLSRAERDPFEVRPPSRLRQLWTLWRSSRNRRFTK